MTSRDAETLGDRFLKVDHAGEHGAVNIYRGQAWAARFTAPDLLPELREFHAHECGHRALFAAELQRRARRRCRSYALCGIGGWALGLITGLLGRGAIVAEETEHHDRSAERLSPDSWWMKTIAPIVSASTETVIWLGMRL
ncbi:MAG: demethoxyubiquinone hydroxylase family protein [Lysobacter sp.]|nr:MAG: demethoxyubiquinone hydroxylase family protein [Lysobacter sp.]